MNKLGSIGEIQLSRHRIKLWSEINENWENLKDVPLFCLWLAFPSMDSVLDRLEQEIQYKRSKCVSTVEADIDWDSEDSSPE